MRIYFIIAILLLAGLVQAATITVCPRGCEYSSIQAAINVASSGDTIEVHSGTYLEHVTLNKTLKLLGVNTNGTKPIIDASYYHCPVIISSNGVYIEGFDVTHSGNSWFSAGIYGKTNNSVIKNVTATKNYNGIHLGYSNNNTIEDNYVFNNIEEGIALAFNSESNIVKNNEVAYHQNNSGIDLYDNCTYNVVEKNSIHDNKWGIGEGDSHGNVLRDNFYYNNLNDNNYVRYST